MTHWRQHTDSSQTSRIRRRGATADRPDTRGDRTRDRTEFERRDTRRPTGRTLIKPYSVHAYSHTRSTPVRLFAYMCMYTEKTRSPVRSGAPLRPQILYARRCRPGHAPQHRRRPKEPTLSDPLTLHSPNISLVISTSTRNGRRIRHTKAPPRPPDSSELQFKSRRRRRARRP